MDVNFVDEYVNKCLENGITKISDICDSAIKEIDDIDEQIKNLQTLRVKRDGLVGVLRNFNHESVKIKTRRSYQPMVNEDISSLNDDPECVDLLVNICNKVEAFNRPISTGILIKEIGYDSNPDGVYAGLKWLFNHGIVARTEDRTLIKGPNWDDKDTLIKV
jgi:hypothetical protein